MSNKKSYVIVLNMDYTPCWLVEQLPPNRQELFLGRENNLVSYHTGKKKENTDGYCKNKQKNKQKQINE